MRNDYHDKNEELETTVSKLKLQLKSAQIELEQTRATLKTMEGSDGHGKCASRICIKPLLLCEG